MAKFIIMKHTTQYNYGHFLAQSYEYEREVQYLFEKAWDDRLLPNKEIKY